jgi:hypothetical protein
MVSRLLTMATSVFELLEMKMTMEQQKMKMTKMKMKRHCEEG